MVYTLAIITAVLSVSCLNAAESFDEDDVIEGNLTDIYFKGLKVTEPRGFCKDNVCLTKCCPFGSGYNVTSKQCVNSTQIFDPPIYDKYLRRQSLNATDIFYFKFGISQCDGMVRFVASIFASYRNTDYLFRSDGKLYMASPNTVPPWFLVNPEHYCIDNFVENGNKSTVDALFCYVEDEAISEHIVLRATCMLVSCVFILLTVGVYLWLPKLHNVHGRVLVAYLMCLFMGFLLMATLQLLLYYDTTTTESCVTLTFIIYFSMLSAFFWLNVMCYDIWRVFSGNRELRSQKQTVWSQVRSYAMYAFGMPTILTILLISLEFSGLPRNPWLPLIRFQGCFITGNTRLLYLYGPIFILCVANMVLFILTAIRIAVTRKETAMLSSKESTRHDQRKNDKQTLLLYLKLFVLMGISWIIEVISAFYPSENWIYPDVYNVLIGVVIFIIFVCKRQIFQLLRERYKRTRWYSGSKSITSSSRTTTTKDETALNSSYTQ